MVGVGSDQLGLEDDGVDVVVANVLDAMGSGAMGHHAAVGEFGFHGFAVLHVDAGLAAFDELH